MPSTSDDSGQPITAAGRCSMAGGHTDRYTWFSGPTACTPPFGNSSTPKRSIPSASTRGVSWPPGGAPAHGDGRAAVWSVLLASGSAFLTIPISDRQVYCNCDGPAEDPRPLRELLAGYAEPVPTLLDALDEIGSESAVHAGPVEEVVLDNFQLAEDDIARTAEAYGKNLERLQRAKATYDPHNLFRSTATTLRCVLRSTAPSSWWGTDLVDPPAPGGTNPRSYGTGSAGGPIHDGSSARVVERLS